MAALALMIAIPLLANALLRRKVVAFLVSVPFGVFVLWASMLWNETHAPGSDLDIVFGFACVLWAAVVVFAYAVISALFALMARIIRHRNVVQPNDGETGVTSGRNLGPKVLLVLMIFVLLTAPTLFLFWPAAINVAITVEPSSFARYDDGAGNLPLAHGFGSPIDRTDLCGC